MAGFLRDFNAAVATYTAELEQLHARCGATTERAFQPTFWLQHDDFTLARDVFVAAAGSIGHEITKFSLVYSKTPSQEDAESICRAINKPCEQLLSATKVALFCGAGPSLAEELVLGALRVMKSVQELGSTIAKDELARVPELTGRVWESCKAVTNTPKSNCIASKRSMLQCISVLNDTIKELKEFLAEQASEAEAGESLNDVEDEDDFAFDSSLSDDERALFESGVKLLDMTVAVLKRGVLTLKNLTIADAQQELIAWTAALDRSYKAIQDAVVDMGAALYPPVDVEELTAALAKAEAAGVAGLECLLAQPEIGEAELLALGKGRRAFDQQPLFSMTRDKIHPANVGNMSIANDELYATPEFVGYSLWLVPDEATEKRLHREIQELAARLGTPPFLPHATLLGGVVGMEAAQAAELTKRVADGLHAMDAEISVVSSKDLLYFQCVFGLLKLSDELRQARSFAMEVFERAEEPEFMPHVSLVYGDLSAIERKGLAQELGPRLDGLKMTMEKLQVWNTTGPVKNWSLVAEYPLSRGETQLKN